MKYLLEQGKKISACWLPLQQQLLLHLLEPASCRCQQCWLQCCWICIKQLQAVPCKRKNTNWAIAAPAVAAAAAAALVVHHSAINKKQPLKLQSMSLGGIQVTSVVASVQGTLPRAAHKVSDCPHYKGRLLKRTASNQPFPNSIHCCRTELQLNRAPSIAAVTPSPPPPYLKEHDQTKHNSARRTACDDTILDRLEDRLPSSMPPPTSLSLCQNLMNNLLNCMFCTASEQKAPESLPYEALML
eukprot:1155807-Pelagomonas_calceolata.AAC.11